MSFFYSTPDTGQSAVNTNSKKSQELNKKCMWLKNINILSVITLAIACFFAGNRDRNFNYQYMDIYMSACVCLCVFCLHYSQRQ